MESRKDFSGYEFDTEWILLYIFQCTTDPFEGLSCFQHCLQGVMWCTAFAMQIQGPPSFALLCLHSICLRMVQTFLLLKVQCRQAQQIPFLYHITGNTDTHTDTTMIILIFLNVIYYIFDKKIQYFI